MLASLQASLPSDLDYEVILVDDDSTDGTRAWLATLDDARFRIHLNPHNLGFARSCNAGVALAQGDVIGLLNNDLLFEPGWLAPMLAVLDTPRLRAGVVGNVQFRVTDGALDHAGLRLNLHAQFEHVRSLPADGGDAVEMTAVTGACMLLRKADFDAVGGLDVRYVNGAEDVDLCFKLREVGRKVYLAPHSRIRHHVSLSRKQIEERDERNSQILFARWRKRIKRELADAWAARLQGKGAMAEGDALLATLDPAFVATPHAAALVIAEALLCQQAQRWARLLDADTAKDERPDARCHFRGLQYDRAEQAFVLAGTAQLTVEALPGAINFHVCGRTGPLPAGHSLQLHIDINGVQRVETRLSANAHFNAGLPRPLLLNGAPNTFTLRTALLDPTGTPCAGADAELRVSHFVIDGHMVTPRR